MRTLPPGRTAVLVAAVFVSLLVAALLLASTVRTILGGGAAWHVVGLLVLAVAGLVVGAIDGRRCVSDPVEATITGATMGALFGALVGLLWPVAIWLAACFVAVTYGLVPWARNAVVEE